MSATSNSREALAQAGNVDAQLELALEYEAQDNTMVARAWFARAAKGGSVPALRLLGISLLMHEPMDGDRGVNMVRAAADKGDAEAAHICAMMAASDPLAPDRWNLARQSLEIAAERGWTFAQEQLDFLKSTDHDFAAPLPPQREVFASPRISVIEGCASAAECDWLIARARPRLHRAHVIDPVTGGGRLESVRSNSSAAFGLLQCDIVLAHLRARIEAITGVAHLEATSILHYAPGQEFKPHFDFLEPTQPGYVRDIEKLGQRVATLLIYLNEEFEGGETEFPKLDWRFRGRKGDALLFWNVDEAGGRHPGAFHAGLPPKSGEKWLLSQWLRRGIEPQRF